jgi:CubicO group peptidase (beta-lactamase class C family)
MIRIFNGLFSVMLQGGSLLLLLCLGFWSKQQQKAPAQPVTMLQASFSPQSTDWSPIDSCLSELNKELALTGTGFALMINDEVVYATGYGYADLVNQTPIYPWHAFRLASVSKLITAIGIMKLVEDGRLKLDDKVFGPEGLLQKPPYDQLGDRHLLDVTVRHILTHTAGWHKNALGDPMFMPLETAELLQVQAPPSFDKVANYVLRQRLRSTPGKVFSYSNFGYALLGKLIEEITRQPYAHFLQQEIFIPHGIDMQLGKTGLADRFHNEVFYYDFRQNNKRLALDGTGDWVPSPYADAYLPLIGAAGAWVATPTDMLKLLALVNGHPGKKDLLSAENLEEMVTLAEPAKVPIGWRAVVGDTWWRTGTLAGALSLVVRMDSRVSWMVVTNSSTRKTDYFHGTALMKLNATIADLTGRPDVFQQVVAAQ